MPLHAMYVNQGAQGCDMKLTFAVIFTLLRKGGHVDSCNHMELLV